MMFTRHIIQGMGFFCHIKNIKPSGFTFCFHKCIFGDTNQLWMLSISPNVSRRLSILRSLVVEFAILWFNSITW